ncbi:ATP-binding response regulator [Algoriphagus resistens]|uniref:ATP-binding response regulator n=1 Tax=Algoriphagus resistens TaxID=1750590 RepID=UPI000AC22347|nr:ATP-binding protein [Algoriphagus resistens]
MMKSESVRYFDELSHEIRNSLNIVIGSSELLKDSEGDDQKELVNIIHNSACHLKDLLNKYLVNREAEEDLGNGNEFDLHKLVEELISQYAVLCKKNGLSLVLDIDPLLPVHLIGSKTKLTQILNNLFGNALNFTEQGFIELSIQLLKSEGDSVEIHFAVKDSGIGINQKDQEKLFRDFVQIPGKTARKQRGSGLGLSITRKLLHSMRSEIHLSSESGVGSVFYFDAQFQLAPVRQIGDIPKELQISGGRVLVVDDDVISREMTTKQLKKLGVACDTAESAKETTALLYTNHYPIIFLDLNLPDLDGITLSGRLKRHYPDMKIILVTGEKVLLSEHELSIVGIAKVLPKPYTLQELSEALSCLEISAWLSL